MIVFDIAWLRKKEGRGSTEVKIFYSFRFIFICIDEVSDKAEGGLKLN
jgi:hypothetical protein